MRKYLFLYGLLHDLPRFSLQPSEATEADLDAGQTTGEPDTAGERETCCQGPDDGGVEGVARPQGVHHPARRREGRAGEDLAVVISRVVAAGPLLPPGHHQASPRLQASSPLRHHILRPAQAVIQGHVLHSKY